MKTSAGILPYRRRNGRIELFVVHMGGPYWRRKKRSWSIVKGEVHEHEAPLDAAQREFREETGQEITGVFIPLGEVHTSAKKILVWAVEADPATEIRSNTFTIEWPPKSGKTAIFPEVDRAAWYTPEQARELLVASQLPFLERLTRSVAA